jgi:hypothetical protein
VKRLFILALTTAIIFGLFSSVTKRPFPKRLLGYYYGFQDAYEIQHQNTILEIPTSKIAVKLSYSELLIQTPGRNIKARYDISAPTKSYYALKVFTEDGVIEEWRLFRRGKKLVRKAASPRPEVVLVKT